jgi:hypothetical protein
LSRSEHLSLDDIHVEIAVVVVVEERDAGWKDLRIKKLPRGTVEVNEVESCFQRPIDEPLARLRHGDGFAALHLLTLATRGQRHDRQCEDEANDHAIVIPDRDPHRSSAHRAAADVTSREAPRSPGMEART